MIGIGRNPQLAVRGMIPEPVEQPPQHTVGDNYVEFTGTAPDRASLARQIAHMLRRTGKTPDDLASGNNITFKTEKRRWFANSVEATVVLGELELQACAKMPFELLAFHEPELARRTELKLAAKLIRHSESLDIRLDAVTHGPLTGVLRPPLHSCEVWTTGPYVIGKVVLFGGFPVTVPLAHLWQGPRFSAVHVVDPMSGRVLFHEARFQDGPCPAGWPARLDDAGSREGYVRRLAAHMHEVMQEATVIESRKRIESAWRRDLAGRAPHEADLQRLQALLDEDQDRRARRQDEVQPSDAAEMLRLVRMEYERLREDDSGEQRP